MSAASDDDVLKAFAAAFFRRDFEALAEVTSDDFEWHFAFGPDLPKGRVYRGLDGLHQGFAERDRMITRARYDDVEVSPMAGGAVMTYRVHGEFANGKAFNVRGIELYRFRDGRVALKDAYWKQPLAQEQVPA